MFVRPHWRDPELYKWLLEPELDNFIAWEFLRRNPAYQKDADAYRDEEIEFHRKNPKADTGDGSLYMDYCPERFEYWCTYCENRWRLNRPLMTEGDEFSGDDFIMPVYCWRDRFKPEGFKGVEGPYVLIPVDLSMPLKDLEKQVMWRVLRLRNIGIEQGTVTPRTSRVLAPRVYVEYLRILDAFATGASAREIGEVLTPGATNDPEARQRDKRIKAAHTAALKMQEEGYRALI